MNHYHVTASFETADQRFAIRAQKQIQDLLNKLDAKRPDDETDSGLDSFSAAEVAEWTTDAGDIKEAEVEEAERYECDFCGAEVIGENNILTCPGCEAGICRECVSIDGHCQDCDENEGGPDQEA